MSTKKLRIFSIAMAGGLAVTGATVAGMTSGHAPAHAALAAHMASSPPVNLDNCAVLAEGYTGGCAAQLQTELNADNGTNMTVDGIFGRQTKDAVITFQQNHQIVPADGIVGPQTKAALDNSIPSPVKAPASTPAQAPSTSSPIPAQGAADAVALSPGQPNCTAYSEGALWQTSTNWARVRYQPCLQESSDGSTVTPIINVQFDWPLKSPCSLSVGFPPSVGLDCPLTILAKPFHEITFQAYTSYNSQPVDFEIPLEITGPDGLSYSSWCYYSPLDTSTNTSTYRASDNGGRTTLTCNGPTYTRVIGTYTVGSLGPRGDVKDDGADARILTAGQMQFVSS
jgi:peptidoglycan hydrolase-like protein with peptidoglycan-binding domain